MPAQQPPSICDPLSLRAIIGGRRQARHHGRRAALRAHVAAKTWRQTPKRRPSRDTSMPRSGRSKWPLAGRTHWTNTE
eukprot:11188174-Lingulodinium_polyedra.AAC.1